MVAARDHSIVCPWWRSNPNTEKHGKIHLGQKSCDSKWIARDVGLRIGSFPRSVGIASILLVLGPRATDSVMLLCSGRTEAKREGKRPWVVPVAHTSFPERHAPNRLLEIAHVGSLP